MTDDGGTADVPTYVPARMVNEYTYCPRLFHLEWVSAQWAANEDTAEGSFAHRRVDRPGGTMPVPDAPSERARARSVQVSSERLGLIATIDVVEAEDGSVRPVDTKRGHPPSVPEGAYEPERVQVCVQGLLLREAGYRCDEGVLYYADAQRRVVVPFDETLVSRTLSLVEELRLAAAKPEAPPPLVDSPKCPRCSLVGICLPDETNVLAGRRDMPPRRLVPRDPAPRPLYVTEQGSRVGRDGGRIEVRKDRDLLVSVRLIDVSQLCVFGNVSISTPLLRELFAAEVPVCWYSYAGWFSGIATGLPSKHVELRRRQVGLASGGSTVGVRIAKAMVSAKIRNQRTILRRNARADVPEALGQLAQAVTTAGDASSAASLLGAEGAAARSYFGAFPCMIREDMRLPGLPFSFEGRNRRPPRDAINCLLSFIYALIVKDLQATCLAVGFDPYLGFYHRPRFGRPALALDIAEEFRPLIGDSVVLSLVNNGEVGPSDFVVRGVGVALTANGRKAALRGYERRLDLEVRHPLFGYRVTYRRLLELQTRLLAAHVLGEVTDYVPFTTR